MVPHDSSRMNIVTTATSLARLLWWYGEDGLWPAALKLRADDMALLPPKFARLYLNPDLVEAIWHNAPLKSAYYLIPAIELLEGTERPAALRRRRPKSTMPKALVEYDGWTDLALKQVPNLLDGNRRDEFR